MTRERMDRMKTYSITDTGALREMNQDYFFASDDPVGNLPNLYIVADGMGGHKAGDYASRYTTQRMVASVSRSPGEEPVTILQEAITTANKLLIEEAAEDETKRGMGIYLNPSADGFASIMKTGDYVDKTGLITYMNAVLNSSRNMLCSSRPRRFGKSYAAQMLSAFYSKGADAGELFAHLRVANPPEETKEKEKEWYNKYRNNCDVLFWDMAWFISNAQNIEDTILNLQRDIGKELREAFPDCVTEEVVSLPEILLTISVKTGHKFLIIIDEWDALFREAPENTELQKTYIQLLRALFKGIQVSRFLCGAYMTGILPIKKYGTQSALTDFTEFTMLEPGPLAPYVGFTEDEVKKLCTGHHMDYEEMRRWYDGYYFDEIGHVYNPNSVIKAVFCGKYSNYWTQTETYESLRIYIDLNFDGLKECLVDMLGGKRCRVDIGSFQNDMTSMKSRDDVLTLLVHLGYLGYDADNKEVYIPNEEIREEFIRAIKNGRRQELVKAIQLSDHLLKATINLHY